MRIPAEWLADDRAGSLLNTNTSFRNWGLTGAAFLIAGALALGQTNSPRPDGLLRSAAEALAAGDIQRAEQDLNSLLHTSPNDYRALDLLGMLRAQQQRNPEAETLFRQSIRVKHDFASAHIHLGLLYLQMNQADQAIAEFFF